MSLKAGDKFPDDVVFSYIPYTEEAADITACGIPINYNASKEWANKKVVLFSVPGAFTPGCSVRHLPGYIEKLEEIKGKKVDIVAVLAYNDAFVMSAWAKANGIKNREEDIYHCCAVRIVNPYRLFLCDPETKFSKSIGWNLGERTARYALIVDNGKVVYAEKEPGRDVTVSGALAVLAKL
ncbi:Redoxin [Exophiala viscosa]|uniref:Redoxin n=1 Tax=Exophiala viscosa TaxID=2486360 RepID=UPI002198F1B9|nr:Redoxin [Exophiala viscosa]